MPTLRPWPMYFAKLPLKTAGLCLNVGDPFPVQVKPAIRGFGAAYGVPNADTMDFKDLPYVETIDVRTAATAREVLREKLTAKQARQRAHVEAA